jgi:hypothetical protein
MKEVAAALKAADKPTVLRVASIVCISAALPVSVKLAKAVEPLVSEAINVTI